MGRGEFSAKERLPKGQRYWKNVYNEHGYWTPVTVKECNDMLDAENFEEGNYYLTQQDALNAIKARKEVERTKRRDFALLKRDIILRFREEKFRDRTKNKE